MKHCKWCNEDRPIEDFHKHSGMADGGLNTPDNLRIIPPLLNSIKSNVYWSDMPDSTKASKTLMNYRKQND
jgi:hypothetical protein